MRKDTPMVTLPLDEPLRESRRQSTSMSIPLAVHHRLDVLADLAAVVNTSRAEIMGMLIAEAEPDAEHLEERIIAYRRKTVGDVVPRQAGDLADTNEADNVVALPLRQPGRPSSRIAG
jgi:hypothetical protein